ncbi:hypothetical protein QTO34_000277 [Cnephaeus nilssonii]|uniref:Uncharacterized protein n=1 Tax=Cnephaeus nilssonii TaxID=3371016 RepID=A0AA40IBR0_CNENI|nr:hypothetical protein QTO34_000277 [Eptesicus nilssonii]
MPLGSAETKPEGVRPALSPFVPHPELKVALEPTLLPWPGHMVGCLGVHGMVLSARGFWGELKMTGYNEFKLNEPPEDGISSVKFNPNTFQFLLVSSWDTSVCLYDVPVNSIWFKYQYTSTMLDCAF